ncbi:MAG TPA: BlaI/MecI/CopY family transcriptional regulator [Rhizobiales bacterium]|nr:BlaI/MecI/CopY family transcriptional regulator [Hyphomicrobiales bacterium]
MTPLPNPPELILLKALWAHGDMPVRRLHDVCASDLGWSFSSTRKTIDRMADKGFVSVHKGSGPAKVSARVSKTTTLARMARAFFGQVLEVDGPLPATAFSGSRLLSDEELDELEGLLDLRDH